jgi:hypothetical protein
LLGDLGSSSPIQISETYLQLVGDFVDLHTSMEEGEARRKERRGEKERSHSSSTSRISLRSRLEGKLGGKEPYQKSLLAFNVPANSRAHSLASAFGISEKRGKRRRHLSSLSFLWTGGTAISISASIFFLISGKDSGREKARWTHSTVPRMLYVPAHSRGRGRSHNMKYIVLIIVGLI